MIFTKLRNSFSQVPLLGWLLGALIAVVLEYYLGDALADVLRLPKIPVLFGFVIMLKKPLLIPSVLIFVLLIYALPISAVARLSAPVTNRLVAWLFKFPTIISVGIHLGFLYAILHLWSDISAYRVL
ncbi:MAG: branched-chain amino acid ABC transporter permease, partial [Desulfobacterales bacterium]